MCGGGSCIASGILAFPSQTEIVPVPGAAHAFGSGSGVAWWSGKSAGDTARAAGNGGDFMCGGGSYIASGILAFPSQTEIVPVPGAAHAFGSGSGVA